MGPDYRADVVDEDVLPGEYPGEHLQEHLEIRCRGMRHREAFQLAGFLQLVDEVLERTCTCPLPRLGFGETVSDLDDRLDRQERSQEGPRCPYPTAFSDIVHGVEGPEHANLRDNRPGSCLSGIEIVCGRCDPRSLQHDQRLAQGHGTGVHNPHLDSPAHLFSAGTRGLVGRREPRREREAHDAGTSIVRSLREALCERAG